MLLKASSLSAVKTTDCSFPSINNYSVVDVHTLAIRIIDLDQLVHYGQERFCSFSVKLTGSSVNTTRVTSALHGKHN